MRLATLCAAVGAAVAIPGLAGAGDPALLIDTRPSAPIVLESGGSRDALVTLEVRNPGDKTVRVERFKITYFAGDAVSGTLDPAVPVFVDAGLLSDPRVEAGASQTWAALCLAPPTPRTDRARFEFGLVERRGWRTVRAIQTLDVPLRADVPLATIALPVRGAWRVVQGHTCATSHRRGRMGGEFAWDLVALDEAGRQGTPRFGASHRNDESATFGRPIVSPVAGRVVAAVDGVPDNDEQQAYPRRSIVDAVRVPRWFFGNYVVIDAGGGVYVMLAHLRKGSIVVAPGAVVAEGAALASAGNSGNTMLPHLHVQIMDRADPADPAVSGLPAAFRDYYEATARGETPGEAVLRRVAAGDPPAGAVVFMPEPPPAAR